MTPEQWQSFKELLVITSSLVAVEMTLVILGFVAYHYLYFMPRLKKHAYEEIPYEDKVQKSLMRITKQKPKKSANCFANEMDTQDDDETLLDDTPVDNDEDFTQREIEPVPQKLDRKSTKTAKMCASAKSIEPMRLSVTESIVSPFKTAKVLKGPNANVEGTQSSVTEQPNSEFLNW